MCEAQLKHKHLKYCFLIVFNQEQFYSMAPENYRFMHTMSQCRRGGGLTCGNNTDFNSPIVVFLQLMSFKYVAVNLFNDTSMLLIVIYRPPKRNSDILAESCFHKL